MYSHMRGWSEVVREEVVNSDAPTYYNNGYDNGCNGKNKNIYNDSIILG